MRFVSIVGARPQFIKLAPLSRALRQQHHEVIVHTGQHYDYGMSERFFEELGISDPEYHLNCGPGTHATQTARMMEALEPVLVRERPDWVIVFGDTNSTLAAALVAAKLTVPIAHIEAGLRSFNRSMPEEINRIVTDHLSARLFCPTETARQHLQNEGIVHGVEVVGDVMYDALLQVQPTLSRRAATLLPALGITPRNYMLVTVHRAANTDTLSTMQHIALALNMIQMPIIFPVHPRTRACLKRYNIFFDDHVQLIEPAGYVDMLTLQHSAYRVLTDSGGIQKEAFFLKVPCITLREETEWPETVAAGWNTLVGTEWRAIIAALQREEGPQGDDASVATTYPFGRGDAAQTIVQSLSRESSIDCSG